MAIAVRDLEALEELSASGAARVMKRRRTTVIAWFEAGYFPAAHRVGGLQWRIPRYGIEEGLAIVARMEGQPREQMGAVEVRDRAARVEPDAMRSLRTSQTAAVTTETTADVPGRLLERRIGTPAVPAVEQNE